MAAWSRALCGTAVMTLLLCSSYVSGSDFQAFPVPAPPLDEIYRKYYYSWPRSSEYCIANANIFQVDPSFNLGGGGRPTQIAGCETPSAAVANTLTLVAEGDYTTLFGIPLSANMNEAFALAAEQLRTWLPAAADGDDRGAGLVIDAPSVNMSMVIGAVTAYNAGERRGRARVNGVFLFESAVDDRGVFGGSSVDRMSPYAAAHNWTSSEEVRSSDVAWRTYSWMTMVVIPTASASSWTRVKQDALFNKKRWESSGNTASVGDSPRFVAETSYVMNMIRDRVSDAQIEQASRDQELAPTCLTLHTPSCLPIGGLSVFGSTHKNLISRVDDPVTGGLPPAQRTILIVVSSSSTALFHQNVPGANGAASGIVSGMLVAEAFSAKLGSILRRRVQYRSTTNTSTLEWATSQIAFLFATGDDYGLAGSGRFVRSVFSGAGYCERKPSVNSTDGVSCVLPWTRSTNFTAMRIQDFTHVIELDKTANHVDDPVPQMFVHLDRTQQTTSVTQRPPTYDFANSAEQGDLRQKFIDAEAVLSSENQLPPSSIFAFRGYAAFKNANISVGRVPRDSWVDRWSGSTHPTTLAVLSAYDSRFDPAIYSSKDVPSRWNSRQPQVAAGIVAKVISDILWQEYQAFLQDQPEGYAVVSDTSSLPLDLTQRDFDTADISASRAATLWECFAEDLACDYVTLTLGLSAANPSKPNYYPGVAGLMDIVSNEQSIIYYTLLDILEDGTTLDGVPCNACPLNYDCVRGRCILRHAWYMHAASPALDFIRDGFKYFRQNPQTQRLQTDAGPLMFGLTPSILRQIWVESFWRNIGARTSMASTEAHTAYIPAMGGASLVLCFVAEVFRRHIADRLKA